MPKLEVFDPPMCCPSGVCGPSPNQILPRFSADLEWLRNQGVTVERFSLSQQPDVFARHVTVTGELVKWGNKCLPLILVDGNIVSRGNYLNRSELAKFVGIESDETGGTVPPKRSCCGGGSGSSSNCC